MGTWGGGGVLVRLKGLGRLRCWVEGLHSWLLRQVAPTPWGWLRVEGVIRIGFGAHDTIVIRRNPPK